MFSSGKLLRDSDENRVNARSQIRILPASTWRVRNPVRTAIQSSEVSSKLGEVIIWYHTRRHSWSTTNQLWASTNTPAYIAQKQLHCAKTISTNLTHLSFSLLNNKTNNENTTTGTSKTRDHARFCPLQQKSLAPNPYNNHNLHPTFQNRIPTPDPHEQISHTKFCNIRTKLKSRWRMNPFHSLLFMNDILMNVLSSSTNLIAWTMASFFQFDVLIELFIQDEKKNFFRNLEIGFRSNCLAITTSTLHITLRLKNWSFAHQT
jgi:hypothetical protein